jgi:DNA-binding CsgD family transcriptional regulator
VRIAVVGDTHLTAREIQVLRLIADGRSTAQVARDLSLSVHTVKAHLARMVKRFGVRNRAALVAVGIRARIIPVQWTQEVSLDPMERRLVGLIAAGLTYREMAARLRFSVPSLKYRAGVVAKRLGAADHAHLVRLAADGGFMPPKPVLVQKDRKAPVSELGGVSNA